MTRNFFVNTIYKAIDNAFDKGWRDFVNKIHKENQRSNERLFNVLEVIKGIQWVCELRNLAKNINEHSQIRIVKKPDGLVFKVKNWPTINEIWIEQKSSVEGGMSGSVYVQVKPNRWLKIQYHKY